MLSLVVIAKNEADRISACLRSVPFADEVIVLDSGSSDGTAEIAESLGAIVHRTDWPGYVAQKNRALALATGPWVLSLDADEALSPEAQEQIKRVLQEPLEVTAFSFARRNRWLGTVLRWGRPGRERKVRLVLKDRAEWEGDEPHDTLRVVGAVVALSGAIDHDPHRDLSECIRTMDEYARIGATVKVANGRRSSLPLVMLSPIWAFVYGYFVLGGFLDGLPGFAFAWLDATGRLLKHLRTRIYDS